MTEDDANNLATEYTLALMRAGKIPGANPVETREVVAAITMAHQQFAGYFARVPGSAPARTPKPDVGPTPVAPPEDGAS